MPCRKVLLRTGECYHVYNRGNNQQPIFFDRANYLFFLQRLRDYIVPKAAEILVYCLMPNHYHLLVRLNTDQFSDAMQSFGQSYTNAINKRYERVGSLFQGRFQAIHVDREEYLLHLSRYIHLNPVPSLVRRPEDWEFSSYREYIGQRHGTLPSCELILRQFRPPSSRAAADASARSAYRRFVGAGLGRPDSKIQHLLLEST
jgi:REP element-mobilizing transposase RayT